VCVEEKTEELKTIEAEYAKKKEAFDVRSKTRNAK
jgi:hypothetical protein